MNNNAFNQTEILVKSSIDGSLQPSLFFSAKEENRPLLVGLHTWSYDRFNQIKNMLPFAKENDFNLLLPEFRGANKDSSPHPDKACGSELAKQDIKDAIDYVIKNYGVDKNNVFLLGASGGGHMALLMAGYCPKYFKAVASFVPITDLEKWAKQNKNYAPNVYVCCNNSTEEMLKRSPIYYIDAISKANVKIFHGKDDPVVPISHSIDFFNEMQKKYPTAKVFLDVFDGGHQLDMQSASYFILKQYEKKDLTQVTG